MPFIKPRGDKEVAYESFLANVKSFRDIDALPTKQYFGNDMSADGLLAHCASCHKSCHLKCNNDKLMKAI